MIKISPTESDDCGAISPSFMWIYEEHKYYRTPVFLEGEASLSCAEGEKAGSPPVCKIPAYTNHIDPSWMMDESWNRALGPDWNISSEIQTSPSKHKYPLSEAMCWAERGDQIALLSISAFYNRKRFIYQWAGDAEREREMLALQLDALIQAAIPPQTPDSCETLGEDRCSEELLRAFSFGLPQANVSLMQWATALPERVEDRTLESSEVYRDRALSGLHGNTYYSFYELQMPFEDY